MAVNKHLQRYIYLVEEYPYTSVRYFSLLYLVSNNKSYEVKGIENDLRLIKLYNNFPVYAWEYNNIFISKIT